jgi:hypothetical protein
MKPSRAQVVLAAAAALLGAAALAAIVMLTLRSADDPSDARQVFLVGVVATLVSPVAFALLLAAWRQLRPPSLDLVRRQATAARQLERELSDWQYARTQVDEAKATSAEIEVYIELRTRSLDLDRRYQSWESDAHCLHAEFLELVEAGQQLDRDLANNLSVEAQSVLDKIVDPEPSGWARAFDLFVGTAPWPVAGLIKGVIRIMESETSRRSWRLVDEGRTDESAMDFAEPSLEEFGDDVDWDRLAQDATDSPSDEPPGPTGVP